MARVYPFRPYRYTAQAGDPQKLVTQPYDKIPPDWQENYYQASPHNIVRVIKGKDEAGDNDSHNVYTRAAATLRQWMREGILAQDQENAFYPYFQEFEHPETGETFVRKGFIGLFGLEDYEAGVIHRHELTHSGPKLDRLQLTRHTHAHFGQLFVLYDDPRAAVDAILDRAAAGEPLIAVADEYNVRHRVWRISDPEDIETVQDAMARQKLMIADGHHRYETALAFYRENPTLPGADRVMMTFVNLRAPGLVVLPTHRLLDEAPGLQADDFLRRAAELFEVESTASAAQLEQRLEAAPAPDCVIGVAFREGKTALLRALPEKIGAALEDRSPAERSLDVVVLHQVLLARVFGISEEDVRELKNIRYVRGFQAAVGEVTGGKAQVAFLLRPVDVAKVAEISFSGGVMPQKSTDFFPKLLTGLTIYQMG